MISPNCPVIMETTSTTASYNTLEQNLHREHVRSNLGDSTDGLTAIELMEEPSQDPEDEDTLSDDSLRLRLSDDEADSSQPRSKDVPTVPYVSSEQTASQDTAMGVTDSDEKVPINKELKSSKYKPGQPAPKEECQRSKHCSQILSETRVGGKKNINSMWRGGSRRAPSSNNTIHSPKRSLRGHSLHVRYNHNHSNIRKDLSYFNNQDNFGRPPGYRRYGSNWRHLKGKYLHNNTRCIRTKQCSANVKAEKPSAMAIKQLNDSLPSVNDELSRECSHLNLANESTLDSKSCENFRSEHSDWKDRENISGYSYNSQFTSDDWFDGSYENPDKPMLCSETSSSLLSQGSSDFQGIGSALPVQDTESAVLSEQKNEAPTNESPLPQTNSLSSLHLAKDKIDSENGGKTDDAKINNEIDIDVSDDNKTEVNTNGLECDTTEDSNLLEGPSELSEAHDPEPKSDELSTADDHSGEMEISEHRDNNMDETKEVAGEVSDESCSKLAVNNVVDTKDTEERKTESQEFVIPSPNEQEVAEQPTEIVSEDKDTVNGTENQGRKSTLSDNKRRASLENHSVKVAAHDLPQGPTALIIVKENLKKILVCNETCNKPSNDSKPIVTEQNLSKPSINIETQPPPVVMKRSLPDGETAVDKLNNKKMKVSPDLKLSACPKQLENSTTTGLPDEKKESMVNKSSQEAPKPLQFMRKFFQRDMKGKLSKLKREELEELIIQKLVETITMRSEIGRLREQARVSERNQEATRVRCQQLSKQIKDFGMVLSRNAVDRVANNDKPVPPIKINRSVGLQVNFVTEHGIQTLRALSVNNAAKTNVPTPVIVNGSNAKTSEKIPHTTAVRRGLKVRSPRRADAPKSAALPAQPQTSTATPAALVMSSKPPETSHNLSLLSNSKEHLSPSVSIAQPNAAKLQNILVNGKIAHQVNRQVTMPNNLKPESNDLIDLTEEEDKHRSSSNTSGILPMVGTVTPSVGTKVQHTRLQRVVQATVPANVAITTQPANIRVVQSVAQPTPTALVNNINTPRLAYLMPGTPGTGRQLLIAPNPNQIRPVTSTPRGQYSNLTYNSGISTLANGNVRVITTAAPTISNSQPLPAPLPDTPHYPNKNGWKLPPPPPSLKISKVTQGIVLSWNMAQSENYAEIASYQLYAYQEIPGTPPNSNLWKKVGDVRALPLPMACTLKEFTPGNNYHFAVRAVDTHSRLGQYSIPRNISL